MGIRFELSEFEYIGESKSNFILYDGKYIDNEIVDIYIVQKDLDIQSFHVQGIVTIKPWASFLSNEFKELKQIIAPLQVFCSLFDPMIPYLFDLFDYSFL